MTIKEVYEYLESIKKIDCILENKILEKEELYTLATKTTQVLSDMPRSFGQSDKLANLTCEMVEIDNEIAETIQLLLNFKKEVISNLQKIQNVYQYETLYLLYMMKLAKLFRKPLTDLVIPKSLKKKLKLLLRLLTLMKMARLKSLIRLRLMNLIIKNNFYFIKSFKIIRFNNK